jgi:hypothetical protein
MPWFTAYPSPEGDHVNVILHAREGKISEREVVLCDETKVFGMPPPGKQKVT